MPANRCPQPTCKHCLAGTHVASTAAGRSVGVAKEANVVGIRVLDCDGAGSISDVVAGATSTGSCQVDAPAPLGYGAPSRGSEALFTAAVYCHAALEWVADNAAKPAVASLSLGVPSGGWSRAMEVAVERLVQSVGIPVVVAAGNSAKDACSIAPARRGMSGAQQQSPHI